MADSGYVAYTRRLMSCGSVMLQVTLSIELNDSQVDQFESMIPVQLAQPPWNYTVALSKGITVHECHSHNNALVRCAVYTMLVTAYFQ